MLKGRHISSNHKWMKIKILLQKWFLPSEPVGTRCKSRSCVVNIHFGGKCFGPLLQAWFLFCSVDFCWGQRKIERKKVAKSNQNSRECSTTESPKVTFSPEYLARKTSGLRPNTEAETKCSNISKNRGNFAIVKCF